jgi:hypothetical protein
MKVVLTNKEKREFFHTALCNIGSTFANYGLLFDWMQIDYNKAKKQLVAPCYEDVVLKMLQNGAKLIVVDDENNEYTTNITLADIYKRIELVPIHHLLDMANEQDDNVTADVILQICFFKEIVFG